MVSRTEFAALEYSLANLLRRLLEHDYARDLREGREHSTEFVGAAAALDNYDEIHNPGVYVSWKERMKK